MFPSKRQRFSKLLDFIYADNSSNVETVALLSKLNVDKHINVEIELDEFDLTSAESKLTYAKSKNIFGINLN